MNAVLDFFLQRNRFTLFLLISLLMYGACSYVMLSRERTPTIKIPVISVVSEIEGMRGELVEKLLAKPIEKEVRSVSGIKKIASNVSDGRVIVILEFDHDSDMRVAMEDVKARLDTVRPKLPRETTTLFAEEIDLGLLPVVSLAVVGDVQTTLLTKIAKELKSHIEALSDVLSVEASGLREEVVEIRFSPERLDRYGIQISHMIDALRRSYPFVPYSVLETDMGMHKIKLSSELDSRQKILDLVLKSKGSEFVTVSDVADVKLVEKNTRTFSRVNGKPAAVLQISKRTGSSVTDLVKKIRIILEKKSSLIPPGVSIEFLQDQSQEVETILHELENTLLFSVILVLVLMMVFMGLRMALLVGMAIPVSACVGIIVIYLMGYTLNIVILFTLIMVIGMLVDDAIVVSEYADRKMAYGMERMAAYREAASVMFWPIATSTCTRLAVFVPLLFWPGFMGGFMEYIPVVSISTLVGSWITALIFIPVLGSIFGRGSAETEKEIAEVRAIEDFSVEKMSKVTRFYANVLEKVLDHPRKFVFLVSGVLITATITYFVFGPGVEFFPDVEPDRAIIKVKSDNNQSTREKNRLLSEIEERINGVEGVKYVHTTSASGDGEGNIGVVSLEFIPWYAREKASKILSHVSDLLRDVKGVFLDVEYNSMKPSRGKPMVVTLRSKDTNALEAAALFLRDSMAESEGFTGVSSDNEGRGAEWVLEVDRKKALASGVDISTIGSYVSMLTDGLLVGKYHPKGSADEIDIIARFSQDRRSLKNIDNFTINTQAGKVPVSTFVRRSARPDEGVVRRVDGYRAVTISSYMLPGYSLGDGVDHIKEIFAKSIYKDVDLDFFGDMQEQSESQSFLLRAFFLVTLMIVLLLMCEFNSFYYVAVVASAVFLSTTCVFLGFLLTYKVFGIVMGGIGVIVLAGVVVNNNILLIDAYRANFASARNKREAIIKSAVSRLRPIFLTVITGVLGLLPMVMRVSVDFIGRRVLYDSPSSQLWFELSTTTAVGLLCATIITLMFTPAVLMCSGEHDKNCDKIDSE
ncbi:multidrug resistance protein MdtC [Anaplasma platys]|uniref:Multidrug resistance protein MdtC n=1 Tax=Anaplasma platys TaxID=949 RepID=A0A858PXZ2_9RICK|nr:efflux RND transporter permease subunit [Anaplasma platys]QJC27473.1 multidrug resistance protein MdtC [Anaplasma platys]